MDKQEKGPTKEKKNFVLQAATVTQAEEMHVRTLLENVRLENQRD